MYLNICYKREKNKDIINLAVERMVTWCGVCSEQICRIHDRPVILQLAEVRTWLDLENSDPAPLFRLYLPYPAEFMQLHVVSTLSTQCATKGGS